MTLPTYKGQPLFLAYPDRNDDISNTINRIANKLDYNTGTFFTDIKNKYLNTTKTMAWSESSRAAMWAIRATLLSFKGKKKGFWIPTWKNDIPEWTAVTDSNNLFLYLSLPQNSIHSKLYKDNASRLHLIFIRPDFTYVIKAVTGYVLDATHNIIVLDTPFDTTHSSEDFAICSFLTYCRLDTDIVEIAWTTPTAGTVSATVTEIPNEVSRL